MSETVQVVCSPAFRRHGSGLAEPGHLLSGVRPSSGAAMCARCATVEGSNATSGFSVSAPEDGRTPLNADKPGAANGRSQRRAFTLIELMIVIGIMAIIMAIGIPSFVRTIRKESLRKAVSDMVEGCSYARAQAILKGTPMELVIRAEGGHISVEPLRLDPSGASSDSGESSEPRHAAASGPVQFSTQLPDDVAVKLLYVNFQDQMQSPEARVRFFPNGTCDEFTTILFSANGERKISVDVVTGLADVDVIR